MNSNSPVATGAAAVTGAMLGSVIVWLCSAMHVTPPPEEVAGTIGAMILVGGHLIVNWINVRFPAPMQLTEAQIVPTAASQPAFPQPPAQPVFVKPMAAEAPKPLFPQQIG